ncbi:Uma2 family endonuclease [Aquisphaera insulae]|uniref:Uma2 family endonuclease n=1 Tax=Aquisphaera insulae TaxID=2712864 RepID=UPI0013EBE4B1|nr:Uma2 family endonuclease [Aquisphaera insulae]
MTTARTRPSTGTPNRTRRPKRRPIGLHSNGMLMTPEEFDRRTDFDDRYSYELIHGVLIVSPPPGASERGPSDILAHLLLDYMDRHPEGHRLDGTLPEQMIAGAENRRRADRVLWIGLGRAPDPDKDTPTIAIEIVSNRRRDRARDYDEKRREYLAAGIREYWIIDRFRRTMTVYSKEPGESVEVVVKEGETYSSPLLPGFELPLAKIFGVADRWSASKRANQPVETTPAPEQPGQGNVDLPPERG